MNETNSEMNLKEMPFGEKIKLLSETDKAYVQGFIDRAVMECQKTKPAEERDEAGENREETGQA
jgi:hypothetical protein